MIDADDLREASDRDTARSMLGSAIGSGFDADRQRILDLVDEHEDIAVRTCRPGHLTGSAFVVDPSRRLGLLLLHTKLQLWLQPGGHADGDTNLANVALREAEEETGIDGLRVVSPAIDVDIHQVDPPAEDAHLHLDVRFLVLTPPGAEPAINHESQGFRWVSESDLANGDYEAGLQRMGAAAFALVDELNARD